MKRNLCILIALLHFTFTAITLLIKAKEYKDSILSIFYINYIYEMYMNFADKNVIFPASAERLYKHFLHPFAARCFKRRRHVLNINIDSRH